MKPFKIRSSACGKIMNVKALGKTGETYVKEWMKEHLYGRHKEFSSKYTEKGNIVEDNSIDFVADRLGFGMLIKNEEHYSNDFVTGTPDLVLPNAIIDVKNSWDCFTFPLFENDVPNKDYYWQAQCYMWLTDRKRFKLVYVLSDTPEHLIQKDAF